MIQLQILAGKAQGKTISLHRLPCLIGRAPQADFRLTDKGVWDRHLQLSLRPGEGILLEVHPGALVAVNGSRTRETLLCNGDLIEAGAVKLLFFLSPPVQRTFAVREMFLWTSLALIAAAQGALIFWAAQL